MKCLETLADIELIKRFQQGDENAFCVLYHRYQKKIFEITAYYVKDRTLAEDLSQEAYIKMINSIKANRYCDKGKFISWALQIVFNHCMDHLRKKKRISYVSDFQNKVAINFVAPSPETKMVQKQAAAHLHTLLDKLSVEQKQVVYYRHFEELSFKEVANLTDTSVNTSLGRMRYALNHLRTMAQYHRETHF